MIRCPHPPSIHFMDGCHECVRDKERAQRVWLGYRDPCVHSRAEAKMYGCGSKEARP